MPAAEAARRLRLLADGLRRVDPRDVLQAVRCSSGSAATASGSGSPHGDPAGDAQLAVGEPERTEHAVALLRDRMPDDRAGAVVTVRALLWEDDAARAVAARLRAGGFEATVSRARFAGEDDDEDQPWAVVTDAPAVMVEIARRGARRLARRAGPRPRRAPLDLPAAPRRVKGHFRDE